MQYRLVVEWEKDGAPKRRMFRSDFVACDFADTVQVPVVKIYREQRLGSDKWERDWDYDASEYMTRFGYELQDFRKAGTEG